MSIHISVCIPAYNRAALLVPLLQSIVSQDYEHYEIVICEDHSPERTAIAEVAARFSDQYPGRIRYIENEQNLGYDRNLRRLFDTAHGDYVLLMGNDDLLAPGALKCVASAIVRHPNIGVVVRSFASFDNDPAKINQEHRYFDSERFFPSGADSIVTVFRRCVVISGVTIHRDLAQSLATDQLDGTLLYQIYLVARVVGRMNAVFVPQIIALYRNGGIPEFGNAESERGKFVPRNRTPESSLHFMRGVLRVAQYVEDADHVPVRDAILDDYSRYSYPILSIQTDKSTAVFLRYALDLHRLGFGRSKMFYVYCLALLLLGPRNTERIIQFIKKRLGYTPQLGNISGGRST